MLSKFEVPNLQVTLMWIKEQVFRKRKLDIESLSEVGEESKYRLESVNDPGIPLDLDTVLNDIDSREFRLVRDEGL